MGSRLHGRSSGLVTIIILDAVVAAAACSELMWKNGSAMLLSRVDSDVTFTLVGSPRGLSLRRAGNAVRDFICR